MGLGPLVEGTRAASHAAVHAARAAAWPYLAAAPHRSSFWNAGRYVWQLIMGVNFLFQILQKFGAEKPCEPRA